jgi:SAM-dependent methyltransferase
MSVHEDVREYYGKVLSNTADLQTSACCTSDAMPSWLKPLVSNIHDDVLAKYYGCGIVAPEALEGCRILDLGCGSGRDCYVLAQLVGESGEVIGVDMTDEQLSVARQHVDYHREAFAYQTANTRFYQGYIESLSDLDIEPGSVDVIISNCVINLSPDKQAVLKGAFDLLKPGGEMYFSDVYADRRVPESLRNDPMLYGECLGGALYWNDFMTLAKQAGFYDPRLVESRPLEAQSEAVQSRIDGIRFYSATYRLFKIAELEPACEDYGQAVVYRGTVAQHPHRFQLDGHHSIETGKVFPVCGNTYRMLEQGRFKDHFDFIGSWDKHYGIFPGCGTVCPFVDEAPAGESPCC